MARFVKSEKSNCSLLTRLLKNTFGKADRHLIKKYVKGEKSGLIIAEKDYDDSLTPDKTELLKALTNPLETPLLIVFTDKLSFILSILHSYNFEYEMWMKKWDKIYELVLYNTNFSNDIANLMTQYVLGKRDRTELKRFPLSEEELNSDEYSCLAWSDQSVQGYVACKICTVYLTNKYTTFDDFDRWWRNHRKSVHHRRSLQRIAEEQKQQALNGNKIYDKWVLM